MKLRPKKSVPSILLIGPHDPHKGLYSFAAPPMGIWRIAGFLKGRGIYCRIFDPNISDRPGELETLLTDSSFDMIGFSTTGNTLPYDLSLVHLANRLSPDSILFAGGVEATFNYRAILAQAPLDMIVTGEGELPVLRIWEALRDGRPMEGIEGTIIKISDDIMVFPNKVLSCEEFRETSLSLPLDEIPFERYWTKLKGMYGMAEEADEGYLRQIQCISLVTTNYCPLKCSFCSYTNFLEAGSRKGIKVHKLHWEDVLHLVKKALNSHPDAGSVIFRDDLFITRNDRNIKPFCEAIYSAKEKKEIKRDVSFICSSRVDTISKETLKAMRKAGFRLIGYGVESFSKDVLKEFNKDVIFNSIDPAVSSTLEAGIIPFLNIILSSPDSTIDDIANTVARVFDYQVKGCEVSIYLYVIPFSGSALSERADLEPYKTYQEVRIPGTDAIMRQPVKILPRDPASRMFLEKLETRMRSDTDHFMKQFGIKNHLPSRIRSLIAVYGAAKLFEGMGIKLPFSPDDVVSQISRIAINQ